VAANYRHPFHVVVSFVHMFGYGDGLYGGGRVPPPHPFLRSSSVPEQWEPPAAAAAALPTSYDDPLLGRPTRRYYGGRYGSGWPASASSYLRGSSYLRNGGSSAAALANIQAGQHWRSSAPQLLDGRRQGLFGRQSSLTSELEPEPAASALYGGLARPPPSVLALSSAETPTSGHYGGSLSQRSPLTLGRSLQLVTSGALSSGSGLYRSQYATATSGAGPPPPSALAGSDTNGYRRKKTVRFNSEEWSRRPPPPPRLASHLYYDGCDEPYHLGLPHGVAGGGGGLLATEDELWMGVEDVRSGRWARWDGLRQESQESATRDSGIETGSCFTSSEDSNRGDQSKKV
jgi:hypothetical protein